MKFTSNAREIVVTISLCLTALTPALAREIVSIKGSVVNMRAGPSTQAEALWQLEKGYPLQVLKRQGSWLHVRDFENDRGWVARSLTGNTPHHVVKSAVANNRQGPGMQHRIIGKAERLEVVRTRGKKSGWVRIERSDGQTGWMAKRLLWGW